uniref:Reverse transcriptase zinc-binding domain-containing protein n=1 Tax=Cuerna arida TaxID=1464854 RepID=A0A1B6GCE4_9HEMI
MSSQVVGLIKGHSHLRKHLHRVDILWEDPFCRIYDKQEETAEHLLFDCPSIARERYAIFGNLDKGGVFSKVLDRLFSAVCRAAETVNWLASWYTSRVRKRP